MKKIGFIGCGNMGKAMIAGIASSGLIKAENVFIFDLDEKKVNGIVEEFKVSSLKTTKELVKEVDYIVLSVKPNIYGIVLNEIKDEIKDKVVVTIAAGVTIKNVEDIIGTDKKIIRTMPNTPALVGEGMSAICKNGNITDNVLNEVVAIFECFGKAEVVGEYLIDSVIGVSGSAPAYAFMYIEAVADAGVLYGMPRDQAYKFAAQTMMGAAKMVMESGKHPGELKDMVCSPGGTTIEAVKTLETEGFRGAIIKAISACVDKSIAMTK